MATFINTCAWTPCGREFEAQRSTSLYCDGTCRQRANRARQHEKRDAVLYQWRRLSQTDVGEPDAGEPNDNDSDAIRNEPTCSLHPGNQTPGQLRYSMRIAAIEERERDVIYTCLYDCSWVASGRLGVIIPAGLRRLADKPKIIPTEYHEKRYRPNKWERRYRGHLAALEKKSDRDAGRWVLVKCPDCGHRVYGAPNRNRLNVQPHQTGGDEAAPRCPFLGYVPYPAVTLTP